MTRIKAPESRGFKLFTLQSGIGHVWFLGFWNETRYLKYNRAEHAGIKPKHPLTTINTSPSACLWFSPPKRAHMLERKALVKSFFHMCSMFPSPCAPVNLKPFSLMNNCSDHPKAATQGLVHHESCRDRRLQSSRNDQRGQLLAQILPENSNRPPKAAERQSSWSANVKRSVLTRPQRLKNKL